MWTAFLNAMSGITCACPMQLLLSGPSHLMTEVGFIGGQLSGRMLARCLKVFQAPVNTITGHADNIYWQAASLSPRRPSRRGGPRRGQQQGRSHEPRQ